MTSVMTKNNIIGKYLPAKASVHDYGNLLACELPSGEIVSACESLYSHHRLPLITITAFDERETTGFFKVMYVFGLPKENLFLAPFISVEKDFPSLTSSIHEASTYERKIMTFFGLNPKGHPDPRPLILHDNWPDNIFPLRKDFPWSERPEAASDQFHFRKISGEGIYEIPVGPVHAGIIEPGHFRFSVAGEEILLLEPRLGYSHKGSEKLFEELPLPDKVKLAERISGDSSYSHSLAFCLALESLCGITASEKTNYLRVIFCELERIANHLGDIGAIMTDTGFNFGGAQGARLREMVMQINERLTGSRFLRGVNIPGGVSRDIMPDAAEGLSNELDRLAEDFSEVMAVAEGSHSLLNRLKDTGILAHRTARDHGVIGVAGKATGFAADARADYPYAAYDKLTFDIATEKSGDVYARFHVRVKEVYSSFALIKQALENLPSAGGSGAPCVPDFKNNSYALSIVEGWRGDIVYLVATDRHGNISRVDVRDPSFLNWTVLGHAGRGNMVPDFPLINKSFNLSYSGNDL